MPHALIAGTTGSGKSILLHSIISSLLEKNTPETLRFILCDPKRVEFAVYNGLPELLTPVISDARKTLRALTWAIKEMARRYDILAAENVQNIAQYHEEIYKPAIKAKNKTASEIESLPYIVIVMDELADIMYAYPKEMEALLIRLAQMSRAVGIHLLLATQRPTSTVLTAAIKANIPTRIALSLASYVDSRMVIDQNGAEKLSGQGDMLYLNYDSPVLHRIQAHSLTDSEIQARVNRIKKEKYDVFTLDLDPHSDASSNGGTDDLYEDAKVAVIEAGKASTSYLQRKLRIGYSRAALLMDMLEANGVIGPADGVTPRTVKHDKK
jgi:S-DNA-T family DNA segregation ATPase FtsK/SpoIIIE